MWWWLSPLLIFLAVVIIWPSLCDVMQIIRRLRGD